MPKKDNIRQMFDTIASDYDFLNHLMSLGVDRGWRRKALREIVGAEEAPKVLDVACGTGDFSLAIARALAVPAGDAGEHFRNGAVRERAARTRFREPAATAGTAATVTGVDLSEGMLNVMREKVNKAGFAPESAGNVIVTAEVGDAEKLRFEEKTFDVVTVAFGVRNFENRPRGLEEMLRVLKPGGRLVILELSVPSNRILRGCYNLYFQHLLPWIGGLISGDKAAYRYLPASVLAFPGKEAFTAELIRAGFVDVRHRALTRLARRPARCDSLWHLVRMTAEEAGFAEVTVAASILAMADMGLFTLRLGDGPFAISRSDRPKAAPEDSAAWQALQDWKDGRL